MLVGSVHLEPAVSLWPAVPIILLLLLLTDAFVVRTGPWVRGLRSARRRAGIFAGLAAAGVCLIWLGSNGADLNWWAPAWALALFWAVGARELSQALAGPARRSHRWIGRLVCLTGAIVTLLVLSRSRSPDATSLLVWCIVGLTIVGCGWSWRMYRQADVAGSRRIAAPLTLRVLALIVLALILLNPVTRYTRVHYDRATLLVVADQSRSMGIRDIEPSAGGAALSRAAALNRALTTHQYELARLDKDLDVQTYLFGERLVAASDLSVEPKADYTALGDAVQQAYESVLMDDRPLAGILLFTDGVSNLSTVSEPSEAALALSAGRVPLWVVAVGSETPSGQTRSIIGRRLDASRRVAAMDVMPVTATFNYVGLQDQSVVLELLFDGDVAARKRVRPRRIRQTVRTVFEFTPRVGGLHEITVRARAEGGQRPRPQDELSQYVHVTDQVIRVLYLEGKPRYEGTFVVRALAASDRIRLQKAVLAEPGEARLRTTPGGAPGKWQWYHVIILGAMSAGQLSPEQMEQIRAHVSENGCGLAVLGGRGFLGAGAMVDTPLEDLLPVSARATWTDEATQVVPTPQGLDHPICRIAETADGVAQRWSSLPPMQGAALLSDAKPAAVALAATEAGRPLIVGHRFGAGRVLVLGFDSTWRWCMMAPDGVEPHRRFWRQVVLWLANERPTVWIASDKPRYQKPLLVRGRQRVAVTAGVDAPTSAEPLAAVRLEAKLIGPDGEAQPLELSREGDRYQASVSPTEDGSYRLTLSVRSGDRQIGRAENQFTVELPDLEMQNKLPDFDLLRDMASQTVAAGGSFVSLDELGPLLGRIGSTDHRRRQEEHVSRVFIQEQRWLLWTVFCGLVVGEWAVRKRRNLV